MCLAVPMQIEEIDENNFGIVSIDTISYNVNLSLIEDPQKGDFVIVHAGFAIEKLDTGEADKRIELFKEIGKL